MPSDFGNLSMTYGDFVARQNRRRQEEELTAREREAAEARRRAMDSMIDSMLIDDSTPIPISDNWNNPSPSNVNFGTVSTSPWNNNFIASTNAYVTSEQMSAYERIDPVAVPSPPPAPPNRSHRFPVGTIIKWNTKVNSLRMHAEGMGRGGDNNLLKVLEVSSTGRMIHRYRYIYDATDNFDHYEAEYFVEATPGECRRYEEVMASLNPCRVRPDIGIVLEFIGRASDLRGKRGVVIGHARNNAIYFHWFNDVRRDERIAFSDFQISSSQRNSFVPDMATYCTCVSCSSARLPRHMFAISYEGNTLSFCDENCANNAGYAKCGCCGTFVKAIEPLQGCRFVAEGLVCTTCYDQYYVECDTCGQFHHSRYMLTINGDEEEYRCERCAEDQNRLIHSHSYKPRFTFQKMAWENTRYLGIELEIEVDGSREDLAAAIKEWLYNQPKTQDVLTRDGKTIKGKTLDKLVYIKSDGSLRNGIEIVFHPFTLKSLHKNFPLKPFLEFLAKRGGVCKENCGMHVHVSKERLSKIDLVKGKWFFHQCKPFLKKFSQREAFNYCSFDQQAPLADPYRQEYGHYSVLNYASPSCKTLEVRIFKATLDYKKFLANLQFSDCFVDYIQHGAGHAFLRKSSPHVIWQNFIDYAKAQNRYHLFTSWILTRAIV